MLQLQERNYTDMETDIINSIINKIIDGFDFNDEESFRNLSVQEQYCYLGMIFGMNNILEILGEYEDDEKLMKFIDSLESSLGEQE